MTPVAFRGTSQVPTEPALPSMGFKIKPTDNNPSSRYRLTAIPLTFYPLIYSASNAITCSPWDTDGGAAKNGAILPISSSY